MKKKSNVFKTILVTALCLMTLVTFMPAGTLGDVFAADSAAEQQQSTETEQGSQTTKSTGTENNGTTGQKDDTASVSGEEKQDAGKEQNRNNVSYQKNVLPEGSVNSADSDDHTSSTPGTDTAKTILGSAIRFGIVTGTFTLDGDAETNVAARNAVYESAQTGNDLTNDVEQEFIFGSVDNSKSGKPLLLKGKKAFVRCTESDKVKITHESPTDKLSFNTQNTGDQLNHKVQDMMNHVSAKSTEIAGKSASDIKITEGQYDQKYYLNIKDKPDGTYYVNVDKDSFDKIMKDSDKFRINKKPNQTIIFNISADGDLSMQKYSINDTGTDSLLSSGNDVTKTIIWNFTGSGKLDLNGSVSGVIIAPKRDITTYATGSGWIVSNSVTIKSGEWHNTYQNLTPPDTHEEEKTEVSVTKVWDDNNNEAGNRPDANEFKSCIKLMNGQTEVKGYEPEVTDNKDGTYTVKYSGLPKTENGKYTVQEDNVPGYTTQNNTAANGETITNKAETTSVTITKKWEDNNNTAGNRPSAEEFKSKIRLMNGQTEVTEYKLDVTDNGNGTYTVKYTGLPKMENGKEVKYT
ncbi:Cna B-type domain-containing protein, partial [Eubacterium pyruvativorans]|uniref:Cna B-type domain-containing protein n=1 Tax=Eubacterium pyruvativorans TaxID=155865 RepID=UPI0023F0304E